MKVPRWGTPWRLGSFAEACFLALWVILAQASRIRIVSIPETPAEGQSVTFSVENVQGDIQKVNWSRGAASQESSRIFSFSPGQYRPQHNGVQFTNRETGFHNGSMSITGLKPSDVGQYNVDILLRPREFLKASINLKLATSPLATSTTSTNATTATTRTTGIPPIKEVPREPSKMGWIVAGVLVGVLLCGAVGAIMVYRFVLRKSEPSTGETGPSRSPPSKHDDKEPIYDDIEFPLETPKDPLPNSDPLAPLPGTCPKLNSNYTDLLYGDKSVYSEIKR